MSNSIRKKAATLEIGSVIYDIDGEDRLGLGKGVITKLKSDGFLVKFPNKDLPMHMNIELNLWDRAGKRGARRCLLEEEYKKMEEGEI